MEAYWSVPGVELGHGSPKNTSRRTPALFPTELVLPYNPIRNPDKQLRSTRSTATPESWVHDPAARAFYPHVQLSYRRVQPVRVDKFGDSPLLSTIPPIANFATFEHLLLISQCELWEVEV
jgi:hypothetical protein